jgi:hypothetical protein
VRPARPLPMIRVSKLSCGNWAIEYSCFNSNECNNNRPAHGLYTHYATMLCAGLTHEALGQNRLAPPPDDRLSETHAKRARSLPLFPILIAQVMSAIVQNVLRRGCTLSSCADFCPSHMKTD